MQALKRLSTCSFLILMLAVAGITFACAFPLDVDSAYADDSTAYTVTFDSNGGSGSMLAAKVDSLEKYTAPACTLTRGTDEFYAWNTKPDATGVMVKQGETLEGVDAKAGSTVTLYALWRIVIDDCTFAEPKLAIEGGTHLGETASITGYCDHSVDFSKPGRDGETVTRPVKIDVAVGTSKSELTQTVTEGQTVQFTPQRPVTYTVTLMFQRWIYSFDTATQRYSWHQAFVDNGSNQNWSIRVYGSLAVTAAVNLNAAGGKVSPATLYLQDGDTYSSLPAPTRPGYTFASWKLNGQAVSKESVVSFNGSPSLTLTASWNKLVTMKLDANKGTCAKKSITATAGTSVGKLPKAKRKGYAFTGWYTKKNGGAKVTATTPAKASCKKLYAHWKKR